MRNVLIGPVYPFRGGIAHHTTELAKALSLRHSTNIISFKRQYPNFLYPGKTDKDPTNKTILNYAEFSLDPLKPLTWSKTVQRINTIQPDVVIFQWWTTFLSFAYFWISYRLKKEGIPALFIIHNVLPHEEKFWDPFLAKQTLNFGSFFIIHSKNEIPKLKRMIPSADYKYFPLPTYTFFSENKQGKKTAREKLGISEEEFVLLFFGIVRPYKGLSELISALKILKEENLVPLLIIAGEFWEDERLYHNQIRDLGLTRQVIIMNRYIPDDEVTILFSTADVYIAPYRTGTQSGAATIAQSFGMPMIISEPIRDSVEHNPKHLIVRANNSWDIARAIKGLFGSELINKPVDTFASWENLADLIGNLKIYS